MTEKKVPFRKCIGCNEMKDKKQLIRVVKSPNGDMNIDPSGKMAGRGAYVCKNQKCFEAAFKSKRLEKAFKTKIADEIYESLRNTIPTDK